MRAILFGLFVAVSACSSDGKQVVAAKSADATAVATLKEVEHTSYGDIVKANLVIEGARGVLVSADLDCVTVHIGNSHSEKIYVDSYVDTLTGKYPAKDGRISVAIYWTMSNFSAGTKAELREAVLKIDSNQNRPCFVSSEKRAAQ
jgi:hypothetical protein